MIQVLLLIEPNISLANESLLQMIPTCREQLLDPSYLLKEVTLCSSHPGFRFAGLQLQ